MKNTNTRYAPRLGIMERWWIRNAALLVAPLWLVIAFGVALPLFTHVVWIIGLVGLSAVAVGSILGGADRTAGTEERAISLPPSRHEQYWIKAALGLVIPLSAILGVAIIKLDIAARFWGLFCSSEWNLPLDRSGGGVAVLSAIIIPCALFATTYGGAMLAGTPAGLLSSLIVAAACGSCALVEAALWGQPDGSIMLPTVVLVGLLTLLGGYPLYLRRDVAPRAQRSQGLVVAVIVVILLILGILSVTATAWTLQPKEVEEILLEPGPDSAQAVEMSAPDDVVDTRSTITEGGE